MAARGARLGPGGGGMLIGRWGVSRAIRHGGLDRYRKPAPQGGGGEDLVGRYADFDVVAYQDKAMKVLIVSTGFSDLE